MLRTKRIIAVFGGTGATQDDLTLAEQLGRALADRGHLPLTGGTHAAETPIKNRAIQGAGPSPWVGIDRKKSGDAEFYRAGGCGAVLTSDLDEMRNYLEALMCDGAIALTGGTGTRSEVTSALSLQRPVALVGPAWKNLRDTITSDPPRAVDWLIDGSRTTFDASEGSNQALDSCVESAALRRGLARGLRYEFFEADARAVDIVRWMEAELPAESPFPGSLPSGVHDNVAGAYETWLKDHAM